MRSRALAILLKELRELVRDPLYLGLAIVIPQVLMLLLGYGLTLDVRHIRLAVLDHDRSPVSRDYLDGFIRSDYFDFMGLVRDRGEADDWLRSGRARAVIDIPPGFARDLAERSVATVGITVDGSFPTFAQIIVGYIEAVNALFNEQLLARRAATALPVTLYVSVWYNPELESKNFVVPGMLVMLLLVFPALSGALLITREKESGTIFTLYASPARRADILIGKAVPYVAVTLVDYLLLFAMSVWLFRIRFIGSFWVLSTVAALYCVCSIGIGLLISVLARTQLAAMLIAFVATLTPAFNLSGFIAPVSSQDWVGRIAGSLLPATYFMEVSRGSYLKGLGFEVYWRNALALALFAAVVYGLAWWRLRKRVG